MRRGLIRYGERRCGVEVQTLLIYDSMLLVWLAGWPLDYSEANYRASRLRLAVVHVSWFDFDWSAGWLISLPAGWLADWLADWLDGWLAESLADWQMAG